MELGTSIELPVLDSEKDQVTTVSDIAVAVRNIILMGFTKDSCIETSLLAKMVFDKMGIKNRVIPVKVIALNKLAYELRQQNVPIENWPNAAYAIGVGWHTNTDTDTESAFDNGGWNGHLVNVIISENGARNLVDISADQMHRPGYLNIVGPIGMRITGPWTSQDPQSRILVDGTTIVEYTPFSPLEPTGKAYLQTPAWTKNDELFGQLSDQIVALLSGRESSPEKVS